MGCPFGHRWSGALATVTAAIADPTGGDKVSPVIGTMLSLWNKVLYRAAIWRAFSSRWGHRAQAIKTKTELMLKRTLAVLLKSSGH